MKQWNWELENVKSDPKQKPSLFRALRRAFWHQFMIAGVFKLMWSVFLLLGSLTIHTTKPKKKRGEFRLICTLVTAAFFFIQKLVEIVQRRDDPLYWQAWVYASAFFVCCMLIAVRTSIAQNFLTNSMWL